MLVVLGNHAHKDGTNAKPSAQTIVDKTGFSRRTVLSALKRLEERGLIQATAYPKGGAKNGRGQPTIWRCCLDKGAAPAPFKGAANAGKGAANAGRVGGKGAGAAHKPFFEPSKNQAPSERSPYPQTPDELRRQAEVLGQNRARQHFTEDEVRVELEGEFGRYGAEIVTAGLAAFMKQAS